MLCCGIVMHSVPVCGIHSLTLASPILLLAAAEVGWPPLYITCTAEPLAGNDTLQVRYVRSNAQCLVKLCSCACGGVVMCCVYTRSIYVCSAIDRPAGGTHPTCSALTLLTSGISNSSPCAPSPLSLAVSSAVLEEDSTPEPEPEPAPDLPKSESAAEVLFRKLQEAAVKVSVRPYRDQYISSTDSIWKLDHMQNDLRRNQEEKARQDARFCPSHGVVGCQGPFGMRGWSLCVGCLVDCYSWSADAAEVYGITVVVSC
jgi:hypothetical protein